jgi:hypothetical protein
MRAGIVPADAALQLVKDMKRILKMGLQRFVQYRLMSERRSSEEGLEIQKAAASLYMAAMAAKGPKLEEAQPVLEAAVKNETEKYQRQAEEAVKGQEETNGARFELGPINIAVQMVGMIPTSSGELGAFQVTAELPGLPPHVAQVASDHPLYSSQASWYLKQLEIVLGLGPDGFYAANTNRVRGDAEEGLQFAYSLYQVAAALGQPGIEHARGILAQAAAQERADTEAALIERLEEELAEVRAAIAKIKHKRQPRGG